MVAYGTVVLAAVAGAPHCLGMCGPFAGAAGSRPGHVVAYHLGRIGTYAALGALSGAFGHAVPGPPWVGLVLAALLLTWFSLVLAGLAPEPHVLLPGLTRVGARAMRTEGVGARAVLGVVNGLLPCGLVWATLSVAVAAAEPLRGASLLAVFGLATTPALLVAAAGVRRLLGSSLAVRRALAAVVLVGGLWSLGSRAGLGPHLGGGDVAAHLGSEAHP